MIMSNSFEAINYVKENIPFLCIASIFQKDPQVLISHPGVGHDNLAALKGKPILVGAAGRTSFWPFLKAKFGYTEDQARPYTFNMAPFLADKNISQQGFLSSEPYAIEQAGVKPVIHLLADAGFENYNTTINISRKMVDEKKDLVQRFVTASLEGWAEYMKDGPGNAAANALIKKDNPDMGDDKIAHAIKVMNQYGIVRSGDALKLGVGAMTDERWARFYGQMTEAGVFPAASTSRRPTASSSSTRASAFERWRRHDGCRRGHRPGVDHASADRHARRQQAVRQRHAGGPRRQSRSAPG